MGDWMTLATAHVLVGFEICVFGMIGSGGRDDTKGCIITGMLCYLITVILMILMKAGGQGGNQLVKVAACILIFVAAFLVLVGAAIWGDKSNLKGGTSVYNFTLDITASAMGLLAGLFLCMDLMGGGGSGGGSKTAPKRGGANA